MIISLDDANNRGQISFKLSNHETSNYINVQIKFNHRDEPEREFIVKYIKEGW